MARACMLKNIEYVTWYSHFWHAISKKYAAIMTRNEAKSWYDQIDFELIGSNIIEKKKHCRQRQSIKIIALSQFFTVCLRQRVKHIFWKYV